MAKIKKEVEMTLSQLIGWGFKNNIKNRKFMSNSKDYTSVIFDSAGDIEFNSYFSSEDTFTVEVEKEITQETVLPEIVELSKDGGGAQWSQKSINAVKNSFSKEFWLKDGDTMTLIWKDGELL